MGTVLAVQANFYRVSLDGNATLPVRELLCTRRSRLKKVGQRVVVGDRVAIEEPDWAGQRGAIAAVMPRCTYLERPPIANVDLALVTCALAEPEPDPVHLSRFLVQASASGLEVQVCLNKCDLASDLECEQWRSRLEGWGYTPLLLSAKIQVGLNDLLAACRGKLAVLAGASGVGKSSLLNVLVPGLALRTQPVSGRLQHGRHTTRHVELFGLPTGGWIADTPGFNQMELAACQSSSTIQHFPEARQAASCCQFQDCLHQDEPGCAVREMTWERYEIYRQFLAEVLEREAIERDTQDPDEELKNKTRSQGTVTEPRLHARYRQTSRRSNRQRFQILQGDVDALLQSEAAEDF
jgi:ribosome biogenesis GTPase